MIAYVVTNPSLGWDCVVDILFADNESEVEKYLKKKHGKNWEEDYVIHERLVEDLR